MIRLSHSRERGSIPRRGNLLFLVRLKACVPKFKARGERTASPERTLAQASFFASQGIEKSYPKELQQESYQD
jgi:hypothetical protein